MKRLLCTIRVSLTILILSAFQYKGHGQCLVDYTTYNYFCDLDTLILEAVPVTGTGPFSFIWATGATTQSIHIPLLVGNYMLTMTDATGCISIINCHIKPFSSVLFYPYNQNACEGDTVNLWLDWFRDSIPGATYLWSTGATTPTIQLTDDLVWSVTVTDPSTGCSFIIPPGLFDFHPTPYPSIVGPMMLCTNLPVTLSVTGGPFGTIIWYPPFGNGNGLYQDTLVADGPGEYIVWASSPEAGYCWHQDTIEILPGNITPPTLTGPPSLCSGQNGTIAITNSSNFIGFIWNTGATTSSINVTQPGSYTVTVSDSGGCTATSSLTIGDGQGASLSIAQTSATCGQNNGSINLTTTPSGSYAFLWSNGSTTEDLMNIQAGTYTVTVTSTNGCTSTSIVNLPNNSIPVSISFNIIPVTSCSINNGAIDVSISPPGTYSFLWSNGATTEDLTNLASGNYSLTVTTGVNCTATGNYVVDNLSNQPVIQSTMTPTTCGESNGLIELQISSGVEPYSFLWSNGMTSQGLTNIIANSYSVTVTDANGCTSQANVDLPDVNIPISISSNITPNTSCVSQNGNIDLTISPAGLYSFIWNNGMNTEDLTNINAGTYDVTVTLGANCIQTGNFTVPNDADSFTVAGSISDNTSCTIPNGSIDISINPISGYVFSWSSGATTEDLQNLTGDNYTVTVTNSEGCSVTTSFTISNMSVPINISAIISPNTSCQSPNGSINISLSPLGTYTFLWSNGNVTENLQNLAPGNYQVTVTNDDGCTVDSSFTISNQSVSFVLSATPFENNSCTIPNGSLDLNVTPAGTYSFIWSNGSITEDIQSLSSGFYGVTVTDVNQCSVSANYSIANNAPVPIISSVIQPETCGTSNGNIDLSTSPNGNVYVWSNGFTGEDLQNITSGFYTVTVTAINGCNAIDSFVVENQNANFALSGSTLPNTSCSIPNGSLDLTISPSGNYSYIWSNGSFTQDLQNLLPGQYVVTVSDLSQCTSTLSFTVDNITSTPVISETITPGLCGQMNGAIILNVMPSTGNTFLWSNGMTTKDLQNIFSGNYTITVTDNNGCTATRDFIIADISSAISVHGDVNAVSSCIAPNGSIDITITPAGNYTYTWSNGSTTASLQNLTSGIYIVTATDANGCSSAQTFTIDDHSAAPVISQIIVPATCGQNNGSIDINVTPVGDYTFLWSNNQITEDIHNLVAGEYSVTVTDGNGCSAKSIYNIPNQSSTISLFSEVYNDSSCVSPNGAIDLSVTPAGTYSFIWSNGETSEDLLNISSGIYEVTVSDQFNCLSSAVYAVENAATLPILSETQTSTSCGLHNGSIDLTVVPPDSNQFLWSTGETDEDLTDVPEGIYSVTVTNTNGCSSMTEFIVPGSKGIEITIDADLTSIQNGIVMCRLNLNVPVSSIASTVWSPDELLSCYDPVCLDQIFTINRQTLIQVEVADSNGCVGIANLLVDVNKDTAVYIPNVFSPNYDGTNDMFSVYGKEVEEVVLLEIFDRWGNCVFINQTFPPNDPSYGWNGKYKGQSMNPDVFAYRAVVLFTTGEEHSYKGDVTLVK